MMEKSISIALANAFGKIVATMLIGCFAVGLSSRVLEVLVDHRKLGGLELGLLFPPIVKLTDHFLILEF